jgi:hypothetical protein
MHKSGAGRRWPARSAPAVGALVQVIDPERFIFVQKVCSGGRAAQWRGFPAVDLPLSTLLSTAFVNTRENSKPIR